MFISMWSVWMSLPGDTWCIMVHSQAVSWVRCIGLPWEMLLFFIYCPLSRQSLGLTNCQQEGNFNFKHSISCLLSCRILGGFFRCMVLKYHWDVQKLMCHCLCLYGWFSPNTGDYSRIVQSTSLGWPLFDGVRNCPDQAGYFTDWLVKCSLPLFIPWHMWALIPFHLKLKVFPLLLCDRKTKGM